MREHTKYVFHPRLELFRCSEGVLSGYIMGNKISLFERGLNQAFSSFILRHIKEPFCAKDMERFFSGKAGQTPSGEMIRKLEKNHLIRNIDDDPKTSLILLHFTGFSNEKILSISKEFNQECHLILIDGLKEGIDYFKQLNDLKGDPVIFVMSDFKYKHKVSELNLYFFKKGIYWCPLMKDRFGGYIGPLIHSIPSGPCFNCYEEKLYPSGKAMDAADDELPDLSNIFLRVALLEALKVSTNVSPSPVIYSYLLEIDCFNHRSRKHYIWTNSNCRVCGMSCSFFYSAMEDSILELIERDTFLYMWLSQSPGEEIVFDKINSKALQELLGIIAYKIKQIKVVYASTDTKIPCIFILFKGKRIYNEPALIISAAADTDIERGCYRALIEFIQSYNSFFFNWSSLIEKMKKRMARESPLRMTSFMDHAAFYAIYENFSKCEFLFHTAGQKKLSELHGKWNADKKRGELLKSGLKDKTVFIVDVTPIEIEKSHISITRAYSPPPDGSGLQRGSVIPRLFQEKKN